MLMFKRSIFLNLFWYVGTYQFTVQAKKQNTFLNFNAIGLSPNFKMPTNRTFTGPFLTRVVSFESSHLQLSNDATLIKNGPI